MVQNYVKVYYLEVTFLSLSSSLSPSTPIDGLVAYFPICRLAVRHCPFF